MGRPKKPNDIKKRVSYQEARNTKRCVCIALDSFYSKDGKCKLCLNQEQIECFKREAYERKSILHALQR